MTITEFRAWLDGFKEAVVDAPTPEQWAKVLEKLETVHALAPQPSISDHFRSPSIPSYLPNWAAYTNGSQAVVNGHPVGPSD